MKTIIVKMNGNVLKRIPYRTKTEAKNNYKHFLKHGMISSETGLKLENTEFELI